MSQLIINMEELLNYFYISFLTVFWLFKTHLKGLAFGVALLMLLRRPISNIKVLGFKSQLCTWYASFLIMCSGKQQIMTQEVEFLPPVRILVDFLALGFSLAQLWPRGHLKSEPVDGRCVKSVLLQIQCLVKHFQSLC